MATITTPSFTDNVSVVAATTISQAGNPVRGTIDLRSKPGAFISMWIGRKGATAPGTAITVEVRRVLNNGSATVGGTSGPIFSGLSSTAASTATTVNADSSAAGASPATVGIASATNYGSGDIICIYDSSFTRLEFARVAKLSGTTLTLDAPLQFQHTSAQADNVTRVADRFGPVFVPGGSLYEVIFDYAAATSGSDIVALAKAQTYDSDSNA